MKKIIYITLDFIWFHQYEDAPEAVDFLKNLHRHKFNVKVWFAVEHNNRDKEFFIMQNKVYLFIKNKYQQYKNWFLVWSCEMIAQDILEYFTDDQVDFVEVNEDWENGVIFNS